MKNEQKEENGAEYIMENEQKEENGAVNEKGESVSRYYYLTLVGAILSLLCLVMVFIISVIHPNYTTAMYSDLAFFFILFIASICVYGYISVVISSVSKKYNKFLDIDEEKNENDKKIRNIATAHTKKEDDEFVKQTIPPPLPYDCFFTAPCDFYSYFCTIVDYLDTQINAYNKKASILLQDGKTCIIRGVFFYVIVIIVWQILIHVFEFNSKYIYGILSTSLLFIFIEFFGAWFLKQYKQFVDTSTYLIKIKSNLQRYVLVYLALRDAKEKEFDPSSLISLMEKEITWPDTYLLKNPDINFAKECLETAATLVKSLQKENNHKNKKNNK